METLVSVLGLGKHGSSGTVDLAPIRDQSTCNYTLESFCFFILCIVKQSPKLDCLWDG